MKKLLEFFIRLRTWVVNVLSLILLSLPEILTLLSSTDFGDIIPDSYVRLFGVALAILNIWMRPRPAVIASDVEAKS